MGYELTPLTYPGGSEAFSWNALGQRMRSLLNGSQSGTRYTYNGERVLEEITDLGGTPRRYTTEGPSYFGFWMRMYRPGSPNRYPEPDGTGSTRMMADGHGVITDTYTMTAFGQQLSSTGSTYNPFRFGGQWGYYTDPDGSPLVQLGARFYWPELGRFIQQDPAGDGMNWYAYAGNDPVVFIDPTGEVVETAVDAAFAAVDIHAAITCPTWQNIGYATVSVAALALPFVPNVLGYARHGEQALEIGAKLAAKFERHHGTPKQILKLLPDDIVKQVRGTRGRPNRVRLPRDLHRRAHAAGYNQRFLAKIEEAGGRYKVSADDVWRIRGEMMDEFFGVGNW